MVRVVILRASNTFDPLNQKLESKIVELEFQVVSYEREISHLKTTYKNLFNSIKSNRAHAKLHDLIYENAQLRAWGFTNTSKSMKSTTGTSVTLHVDKPKLSAVTPLSKKLHALMSSHSVPQPREFNVVKNRNENVSADMVIASSTRLLHTTRTRRPQPKGKTRNARVPSASKSSEVKKTVIVEEHRRTLLLSKNQKTMSSECNNIKLAIRNDKSKIVYANWSKERLACRLSLKWSPSGRSFDLEGKLVASKETNFPNNDEACTSNPQEPMRKRFPNSTVFLGRLSKFVCGMTTLLLFWVMVILNGKTSLSPGRNTCFIRDLDGVDLLKGNRSINLYTINLYDIASASPICLMARATPTKLWLWHQRLSHLNFDTINDLAKNDLVSGLPKFRYDKEHLCPSCEQGKSKRASHPPKPVPNSKQRLNLIHMDLCGPMRVASINGKRYVLVIVDDYSRYTWVHFLRPDIVHDTYVCPRYQAHPTEKHLKEVKRIFRYLRGTVNMGLCQNRRDLPKDTPIDRLEVLSDDGNPSRANIKQALGRRKIMISSFYCSNDIKSKIKILDRKHAKGTAKNSQVNKGNRVQATCKKEHMNKFQLLLDEGSCYRIEVGRWIAVFYGRAAKFDNLYLNREKMSQVVMILQLEKVKYFNGPGNNTWCKVMIRVIDESGSKSMLLFDDMISKLCGVQVYPLIKKYREEVDDYFPAELNVMVRKKLLFMFEYTNYHIRNNNHVYFVKELPDDENIIATFKKDFIIEEPGNDLQTSGINASGVGDSGSPVSVKHTYIDLDNYPDVDDQAKRGKKIGGKVVVFGGDFHQILPVISNGSKIGGKNDSHAEVKFPEEILIPDSNDHVESVDNVNERMMCKLPGMEKVCYSSDSVSDVDIDFNYDESMYTTEFLNTIRMSGIPNHKKLILKIGAPIMCLLNINQRGGLCNGTRLQIVRMRVTNIEAKIISGGKVGTVIAIPRINISPSDKKMPF
nr:replication protein A 70 kDa DNA-binding subunit B [Tanacetum cinerariifolium]